MRARIRRWWHPGYSGAVMFTPFVVWWRGSPHCWGMRRDSFGRVLCLGSVSIYSRGCHR